MNATLEALLEREIQAVLAVPAADDANADFLAGKLTALCWALAKVRRQERLRRQQANRKLRRFAPNRTPVLK